MTMTSALNGHDIWVRSHYRNGKTSVSHHRVWDIDLFMSSRVHPISDVTKQSPTDVIRCERVTEAQARGKK